jgi:hypothetical protein
MFNVVGGSLFLHDCFVLFCSVFFFFVHHNQQEEEGPPVKLNAITWNMAAINNNPFEYWITTEDAAYNKLMEDVSEFINNPGAKVFLINSSIFFFF